MQLFTSTLLAAACLLSMTHAAPGRVVMSARGIVSPRLMLERDDPALSPRDDGTYTYAPRGGMNKMTFDPVTLAHPDTVLVLARQTGCYDCCTTRAGASCYLDGATHEGWAAITCC